MTLWPVLLHGVETLFSQLTKFQLCLAFIFLMLLRIVVGYHFYKEGTAKLKSGTFTSKYFLSAAKGPFAPYFRGMLEDPDGTERLCINETKDEKDGSVSYSIDTELTFGIWNDFVDKAFDYYGIGSEELIADIDKRGKTLFQEFQKAKADGDDKLVKELREQLDSASASLEYLDEQPAKAEAILKDHQDQLLDFLSYNEVELISHFSTADRLQGFQRDGENREEVATYVDSLRGQVDTIRSDRSKKLAGWSSEVTGIWDSFETQINDLALEEQRLGQDGKKRSKFLIHRPFDDVNAKSKWIDRVIPWFDTIVGVLLIIGLFTRFASMAAALFLVSVILTQPPWIPGTEPTYFYFIELFALLVIFATCAGRMGGLDFFFSNPGVNSQTDLQRNDLQRTQTEA